MDLAPRCGAYRYDGELGADIIIRTEEFRPDTWKPLTGNDDVYCESGSHFHFQLLKHGGSLGGSASGCGKSELQRHADPE